MLPYRKLAGIHVAIKLANSDRTHEVLSARSVTYRETSSATSKQENHLVMNNGVLVFRP